MRDWAACYLFALGLLGEAQIKFAFMAVVLILRFPYMVPSLCSDGILGIGYASICLGGYVFTETDF